MMSFWGLELETSKEMVEKVSEFLTNKSEDELNLSGTGISPYALKEFLSEKGYQEKDFETNGWDWSFIISMENGQEDEILITGTGYTFELKLVRTEL